MLVKFMLVQASPGFGDRGDLRRSGHRRRVSQATTRAYRFLSSMPLIRGSGRNPNLA
jgi:hypothetical protein